MPTPLDILLDPVTLTMMGFIAALLAWEFIAPARPMPRLRG